ncbi:MAG TPA: NADH-quinone oxidoreductase subunit A [Tepidisphaeraceae bacterium]
MTTLGQAMTQVPGGEPPSTWLPVVLLILIGLGFAVGNVIISILVGPRREGAVKGSTYESGMVPIGSAQKRFNVRFYIVAMIFLVIDVEIVFFYPWATIFGRYASDPTLQNRSTWLLGEMIVFVLILLVAYVYAWGKGVFKWD